MIYCATCGVANREGSRFCNECGRPIVEMAFCQRCGFPNLKTARFCNQCGEHFVSSTGTTPPVPQPVRRPAPSREPIPGEPSLFPPLSWAAPVSSEAQIEEVSLEPAPDDSPQPGKQDLPPALDLAPAPRGEELPDFAPQPERDELSAILTGREEKAGDTLAASAETEQSPSTELATYGETSAIEEPVAIEVPVAIEERAAPDEHPAIDERPAGDELSGPVESLFDTEIRPPALDDTFLAAEEPLPGIEELLAGIGQAAHADEDEPAAEELVPLEERLAALEALTPPDKEAPPAAEELPDEESHLSAGGEVLLEHVPPAAKGRGASEEEAPSAEEALPEEGPSPMTAVGEDLEPVRAARERSAPGFRPELAGLEAVEPVAAPCAVVEPTAPGTIPLSEPLSASGEVTAPTFLEAAASTVVVGAEQAGPLPNWLGESGTEAQRRVEVAAVVPATTARAVASALPIAPGITLTRVGALAFSAAPVAIPEPPDFSAAGALMAQLAAQPLLEHAVAMPRGRKGRFRPRVVALIILLMVVDLILAALLAARIGYLPVEVLRFIPGLSLP